MERKARYSWRKRIPACARTQIANGAVEARPRLDPRGVSIPQMLNPCARTEHPQVRYPSLRSEHPQMRTAPVARTARGRARSAIIGACSVRNPRCEIHSRGVSIPRCERLPQPAPHVGAPSLRDVGLGLPQRSDIQSFRVQRVQSSEVDGAASTRNPLWSKRK